MHEVYRVTIHGKTLESRDLRKLLSRAVSEKRDMDHKMRALSGASCPEWLRTANACPAPEAGRKA